MKLRRIFTFATLKSDHKSQLVFERAAPLIGCRNVTTSEKRPIALIPQSDHIERSYPIWKQTPEMDLARQKQRGREMHRVVVVKAVC